jgi:enoyl-CoA hydratase
MPEPVLRVDTVDRVTTVTLNRPDALNALSRELRVAIMQTFQRLSKDPETGVIILTGTGRAFCAGVDLKELSGERDVGADPLSDIDSFKAVEAVDACPVPVIGAINGFAVTGGFELALACDLLVASTEARFGDTHARVGLLPGWGLSQKLPRLVGILRAKEISLTGNFVEAHQAEAWGLVNRVVEPEALLPTCQQLATDILSCVPEAIRGYKRVINEGFATTYEEGLKIEMEATRMRGATTEQIADRRSALQDRGRGQSEDQ